MLVPPGVGGEVHFANFVLPLGGIPSLSWRVVPQHLSLAGLEALQPHFCSPSLLSPASLPTVWLSFDDLGYGLGQVVSPVGPGSPGAFWGPWGAWGSSCQAEVPPHRASLPWRQGMFQESTHLLPLHYISAQICLGDVGPRS